MMEGGLIPITKDRAPLLVCPATDDGIASSIILNRHYPEARNSLFLPEFSVADIFGYPAWLKHRDEVQLILAGFSFQDDVSYMLPRVRSDEVIWYSHHTWANSTRNLVERSGMVTQIDERFATTSRLLIDALHIDDEISVRASDRLALGRKPQGIMKDAFYLSLFARDELYQVRNAFAGWYEPEDGMPESDPAKVAKGRAIYQELFELTQPERVHQFELANSGLKAAVMGLSPSLMMYYRNICGIFYDTSDVDLVIFFVDGNPQIVVSISDEAQGELSAQLLARRIDQIFDGERARLYDRKTLVVQAPRGMMVSTIERLESGLQQYV
ncbi:MAG: hypothetical protein H6685_10185 [Deltaproteobacteria bacterium]|nr:hypothetical protein [Deltaproteobacteria bacterium]